MELTNSLVTNSGGVGDGDYDYDDLFREEEDTGEKSKINIPRLAKKSRAKTKQMSDDDLFLYFQELLCRAGMSIALPQTTEGGQWSLCSCCKVFDWV
jgi:hypothetical protein